MSCPDGVRRPGAGAIIIVGIRRFIDNEEGGPVRLAARRTSAGAAGGRGASRGSRLSTLEVPPPAPAAAPRGRRADERDADAGVRRRKRQRRCKRLSETRPSPPAAPARPRCRVRGVTVAWVLGTVGYQAKGFIHRENTAHGDPCDSPETLPLAHAHWYGRTGSPRTAHFTAQTSPRLL